MTRYVMVAGDADGEPFGERVTSTAPALAEAASFGDVHHATYVSVCDDRDDVTLYGRDGSGSWSLVAADVDAETAEEVCLWFDLTQHYRGEPSTGADRRGRRGGRRLDRARIPAVEPMGAARAVTLVVEQIRARHLDYPTRGLVPERFEAGWSVCAPVTVDTGDPTAFLDLPLGRSVFLVSDTGRIKETSGSIPPQQAREMFTAEEAYVRRPLAGERRMAALEDELWWLEATSGASAGIASFTVDTPVEAVAARASALLAPIAQQVALLGPSGWDRLAATFSVTVSHEVAQVRFWSGNRSTLVRVPEQTALLVRRQRHLAARMPAGPWWRLLLTVDTNTPAGVRMATEYDYGDRPFPADHLLAPEHYRQDLAAYPRPRTPAWLAEHATFGPPPHTAPPRSDVPTPRSRVTPHQPGPRPGSTPPTTRPAGAAHDVTAAPEPRDVPSPWPGWPDGTPVLDTTVGFTRLHADPHVITYGRTSIALEQVEWLSYTATQIAHKRLLFPTFHDNAWEFLVGRYPSPGGPRIVVRFSKGGRNAEQPQAWTFLVNLVRQYLEPRLLGDLVNRVRRGETVTVGGSVKVNQDGISCAQPRVSLPWASMSPPNVHNGMIWIGQPGERKPALTVPLSHPNALLIPDLFASLMR